MFVDGGCPGRVCCGLRVELIPMSVFGARRILSYRIRRGVDWMDGNVWGGGGEKKKMKKEKKEKKEKKGLGFRP